MDRVYNETHVELGQSVRCCGSGAYPSICINNEKTVVQVYNSTGVRKQLWYQVGQVKAGGDISWGSPDQCYDHGLRPRVAINDHGTVVEVHERRFHRDIYYRVGTVNKQDRQPWRILWGTSQKYTDGLAPAVALLNDNTVISVHQTKALGSYTTYYRVGSVDVKNKNITWGESTLYGRGKELALTANQNAVVEVHKSVLGNSLHHCVGHVKSEMQTIDWGEDTVYGEGCRPSVSVNSKGHVLEVHTSVTLRRLYRMIGLVDTETQTLNWVRHSLQYDMGTYPSICLNDNDDKSVVEAHESNLGSSIWCRTGTLKPPKQDA